MTCHDDHASTRAAAAEVVGGRKVPLDDRRPRADRHRRRRLRGESLTRTSRETQALFSHSLAATQGAAALGSALDDVEKVELRRELEVDPARVATLTTELDQDLIPLVLQRITALRTAAAGEEHVLRELTVVEAGFEEYLQLRTAGVPPTTDASALAASSEVPGTAAPLFARMTAITDEIQAEEVEEARAFELEAGGR